MRVVITNLFVCARVLKECLRVAGEYLRHNLMGMFGRFLMQGVVSVTLKHVFLRNNIIKMLMMRLVKHRVA